MKIQTLRMIVTIIVVAIAILGFLGLLKENEGLREQNNGLKNKISMIVRFHWPEELTEIKSGQRLKCDSVVISKNNYKDIYISFDNYAYHVEFSVVPDFAIMGSNDRPIVCNFDSTTDIYKAMLEDNQ